MNRVESVKCGDEIGRSDSDLRGGTTRPYSVIALVLLEAILAFFGFASGSQFILDPSGGTHKMDTSILEGTPVGDFLLVGVFFVTCYGILQVLTIYGLWRLPRWRWTDPINKWTGQNLAWTAAAATGVILIVWIIVEVYYIGSPDGFPRFLQVTFALLGIVILTLALMPRTMAYARLVDSSSDLVGRQLQGVKAMKIERRMRMAGMAASISAMVFAIPHFWFWYGISLAFPGDFHTMSKTNALLIVGGLAILAAVYAIVFTHSSWVKRLPEFVTALPAWVGSVGFTLWGLAYFGLQVQLAFNNDTSSDQYFASDTNPNAIWGLYWYSLFIVWGLSLGMAAFYFHKLKKGQNCAAHENLREARDLTRPTQRVTDCDIPLKTDSNLSQEYRVEGRPYEPMKGGDA